MSATAPESNKERADAKKQPQQAEEELSAEDFKLKEDLEMLVERLTEDNEQLYDSALERLCDAIRTSTSSMTAVPKPLKFLKPHYGTLVDVHAAWKDSDLRKKLADILSVLAMTSSGKNETLKYHLLANSSESVAQWGHEYARHLALEIGEVFRNRLEEEESTEDLVEVALNIVPFFLKHNAEADAVDLLFEVESIEKIVQFVDTETYDRVCRYILSCVPFLPPGDDITCLQTAFTIYMSHKELTQALTVAIRLDNEMLERSVFAATDDPALLKQLAFMVGRQGQWFELEDEETSFCLSNGKLSEYYKYLAKELNLVEPKSHEDIFRNYNEPGIGGASTDPAKQTLASVFVNALINCGYGTDKLMLTDSDESSWLYKAKGTSLTPAAASIGLLHLWDTTNGLPVLDAYQYSSDEHIRAGSLLGIGVLNTGVHDESDPALALLSEAIENKSVPLRTAAIMGLGLSYAGCPRDDLQNLLSPFITDLDLPMEVASLAALSLGLIFVGTASGEITQNIMQAFLERDSTDLGGKWCRFMALGLGLLYVGKSEETETVLETIKVIDHPSSTIVETLVTICSYCGSGNVLQIQKLLRDCATRPYEDEYGESDGENSDVAQDNNNEETGGDSTTKQRRNQGVSSEDASSAREEANSGAEATSQTNADTSTSPVENEASAAAGSTSRVGETEDTQMEDADVQVELPSMEEQESSESHQESRKEAMKLKAYSVLGIAIIAMGDEIGQEMVMRHFSHLMHYGDSHIRRAVPLAMGLVSASNPEIKVYDTLSRFSHDPDIEVAINAIFAMGMVGAGTNNARLAQLLRQLAIYYSRDPDTLFMVRIAQGLLHLGKGVLTLSALNTDRQILSPVALSGLLIISVALLNPKSFILGQNPSMLYYMTLSIQPRMLVTVDEDLEPIKVTVRVGQAVDVVGQAGRRKTITGWVTHTTPVLLAVGERAELEDDEYFPLSQTLEGVVILKKTPDASA